MPRGRRLNAAQQAARDSLIIARQAQDWPWEAIAAEAGISVHAAKRAARERRKTAPIRLNTDPVKIIENVMQGLQLSIGDLEAISSAAMEQNNLAAAVGAKKGANDARQKLTLLLQATGRLPQELGSLRHLIDLRAIAVRMLDAMDGFERGLQMMEMSEEDRAVVLALADRVRTVFFDLIGAEDSDASEEEDDDTIDGDAWPDQRALPEAVA